jgi:hypothetical protein
MPGFAGRQVGIFLKGEASNHKGISGEKLFFNLNAPWSNITGWMRQPITQSSGRI